MQNETQTHEQRTAVLLEEAKQRAAAHGGYVSEHLAALYVSEHLAALYVSEHLAALYDEQQDDEQRAAEQAMEEAAEAARQERKHPTQLDEPALDGPDLERIAEALEHMAECYQDALGDVESATEYSQQEAEFVANMELAQRIRAMLA